MTPNNVIIHLQECTLLSSVKLRSHRMRCDAAQQRIQCERILSLLPNQWWCEWSCLQTQDSSIKFSVCLKFEIVILFTVFSA